MIVAVLIGYRMGQTARPSVSVQPALIKLEQPINLSGTTESQINIERAARQQLARQSKILEEENSKLKEDLAFFESLLPSSKSSAGNGVSIRQLKVDLAGPNQLQYRLLIMQNGKADQDFKGTIQLTLTILQDGKNVLMTFPGNAKQDSTDADKFHLAFKRYQRLEGILTVPPGAHPLSIQARVLENNRMRAQETMVLKGVKGV